MDNKSCAHYYRIGKLDPDNMGIKGDFCDYSLNGKMIYKATMMDGRLNGNALFYYPDGKVMETGRYINGQRAGLWRYYFDNGSARQVLYFNKDTVLVVSQYKKNGKQVVVNGNGYYTSGIDHFGISSVAGNVKNGKMDGKWTLFRNPANPVVVATEIFDNGKFLNGRDDAGDSYNSSRILLHEEAGNEVPTVWVQAHNCLLETIHTETKNGLISEFYPQLIQKLNGLANVKRQWLLIGVDCTDSHHIKLVNVYSSKNDTALEAYIYNYIKDENIWPTNDLIKYNRLSNSNFFTIDIDDNNKEKILIPEEYINRTVLELVKKKTGDPVTTP